jgi:capsular exopolysaccharide synthesis family protein
MSQLFGGDVNDRISGFSEGRQGAVHYLHALRDHWLLVGGLIAASVGIAVAYVATAEKRFEAQSEILVAPISNSDSTFIGFQLLREGDAQTRAALTAARFVKTPRVVDAAAARLAMEPREARKAITVTPVGQADIVTITGKASTPERAVEIADVFADETIKQRTRQFQDELRATIKRLRAQLAPIPPQRRTEPEAVALLQRLGNLTGLVGSSDPTLQLMSNAVPPEKQSWPRPVLSVLVALIASSLLGVGIALGLETVNPRVKREEELLLEQRLPILTRVPRMPRKLIRGYLTGKEPLPGAVREAYRTLRTSLLGAGGGDRFPSVVLVTSAMPGEAKTMTSVNLAITLANSGQRVVLIDGDLRRPMVATLFGVAARSAGFADVLLGRADVTEALVEAPGFGDRLQLMLASPEHAHLIDLLEPGRVERALAEIRLRADVVVIDSPPVTEVADAITLATEADTVLVAVRLGRTRRDRLNELRRMLAQRGIAISGFVVTTRRQRRGGGYYYGSEDDHGLASPRAMAAEAAPQESPPPPDRRPDGDVAPAGARSAPDDF